LSLTREREFYDAAYGVLAGNTMKYLAHSASLEGKPAQPTPSHSGTKHLGQLEVVGVLVLAFFK
jgi:hypothetical protein